MRRFWSWLKRQFKKENENRDQIDDSHVSVGEPQHETDYRVWLPSAENILNTSGVRMNTRGEYSGGFPKGLIVHWTAGWALKKGFWMSPFPMFTSFNEKLKKMARDYALRTAKSTKYNFLVMDVFGNVYQSRPLSKWGYHAGKSYWKGLGYSVSNDLAGVEILNPGKLTKKGDKFFTWFKLEIPKELVRYVTKEQGYPHTGYFCQYTAEQEVGLKKLCKEMMSCSPKGVFRYEYVLGHDEVAPSRKTDPGGALSIPLKEFRENLINE